MKTKTPQSIPAETDMPLGPFSDEAAFAMFAAHYNFVRRTRKASPASSVRMLP
jgi:hypothetical protein